MTRTCDHNLKVVVAQCHDKEAFPGEEVVVEREHLIIWRMSNDCVHISYNIAHLHQSMCCTTLRVRGVAGHAVEVVQQKWKGHLASYKLITVIEIGGDKRRGQPTAFFGYAHPRGSLAVPLRHVPHMTWRARAFEFGFTVSVSFKCYLMGLYMELLFIIIYFMYYKLRAFNVF